jgi:hypothetical protein
VSLLDEAMPTYDAAEVHELLIAAPPPVVYRELLALTPREIRAFGPLMAVRAIPSLLRRRPYGIDPARPVLEQFLELGFARLSEEPGTEIVVGAVGRFWSPAGNRPRSDVRNLEEFTRFVEPGFAKAAMNFRVEPSGDGSRVVTETRIVGTDAAATRSFRRYWRLIRPGSGAIRRSWLKALRRRVAAGHEST